MPRYAELIYNGFWFSPEREMLQALIDKTPGACDRDRAGQAVQGRRPARWRGGRIIRSIREKHVTFEEDAGAYDQKDAEGFIRLNALRLKLIATRNARVQGLTTGSRGVTPWARSPR